MTLSTIKPRLISRSPKTRAAEQRGLTMIELLIALGLGVFLLAGILQVFVGSRQSFEVIHAQSSMQEAGRFSMAMMGAELRQTGYMNIGTITATNGDTMAQQLANIVDGESMMEEKWPDSGNFDAGAAVYGQTDAAGFAGNDAKGNSEFVAFRVQGDPDLNMTDCAGNAMPTGTADIVEMSFYVDTNEQLRCRTGNTDSILVSGVEHMKVQYGLTAATLPPAAVSYVDADSVADWSDVVTVRLGILTVSDNSPLDDSEVDYDLLGEEFTYSEGRARQVFTQTIFLRNR